MRGPGVCGRAGALGGAAAGFACCGGVCTGLAGVAGAEAFTCGGGAIGLVGTGRGATVGVVAAGACGGTTGTTGAATGRGGATVAGVMIRGGGAGATGGVGGAGFGAGGAAAGLACCGGAVTGFGGAVGAGGAAGCFVPMIAFSTSPGLEICERSILVLISSGPAWDARLDLPAPCPSPEPLKCARTFSASCSSSELECVFFSVTPTSVRTSRMALLLTSSSLARSLIRILLIRLFVPPNWSR